MIEIETVVSEPFGENSYIVWKRGQSQAFVIDPGFEPELILQQLHERNLQLVTIVNTHAHLDHIAGNASLKSAFPNASICIGEGEVEWLTDPTLNLSDSYGMSVTSPPADQTVKDGSLVRFADIELEVREVPGHSPGHVIYRIASVQPNIVFGGDVLFRGSVGRTDFPGGSFSQLKTHIHAKLWPMADDTVVYPGHGPVTTIGFEKRTNPYVGFEN